MCRGSSLSTQQFHLLYALRIVQQKHSFLLIVFWSHSMYILKWERSPQQAGTIWNVLEPARMSWNQMKRAETTWNKIDSVTSWYKKQEICRKKLCVQTHCPIEYIISNSYCHKGQHLRYLLEEPPGTEWNQTSWHTKKTLIVQCCVYNIISLQNNFTNCNSHKELHPRCRQGVPDQALLYIYFK